jgi:hypothetical protein
MVSVRDLQSDGNVYQWPTDTDRLPLGAFVT